MYKLKQSYEIFHTSEKQLIEYFAYKKEEKVSIRNIFKHLYNFIRILEECKNKLKELVNNANKVNRVEFMNTNTNESEINFRRKVNRKEQSELQKGNSSHINEYKSNKNKTNNEKSDSHASEKNTSESNPQSNISLVFINSLYSATKLLQLIHVKLRNH